MKLSRDIIKLLESTAKQYIAIENNPSNQEFDNNCLKPIQYSKKDIAKVLECGNANLDHWIKELEEEGEYFVRNNSGNYIIAPEQATLIAQKAGIKTIPEIRVINNDYAVPVVVVNTSKGGIAKSTTTLHLAVSAALDVKKSQRVLLIDGDPQGSIIKQMSPVSDSNEFAGLLSLIKETSHLSREERLSPMNQKKFRNYLLQKVIVESHLTNMWILPANMNDTEIEVELMGALADKGRDCAMALYRDVVITPLLNDFDIIFFDTSPSPNATTGNIYFASNHVIFVTTGRKQDYRSYITHHTYLAETIKKLSPSDFIGFHSMKTIITKHIDKNDTQSEKMSKNVSKVQAISDVYTQVIHENRKYEEAAEAKLPLQLLSSKSDKPYRDAIKEISNLYSQFDATINKHLFED